jgi:hypothetical protein
MNKPPKFSRTVLSRLLFPENCLAKHVNAVALVPVVGGRRITSLGRKLYNVFLHCAQNAGEQDEYEARLHEIVELAGYNSNDTTSIKKTLQELLTTAVEWQSATDGEVERWDSCNLLSGVGITKDKRTKAVTIRWRFDSMILKQMLSPDRYARLSIEAITQLSTHAAMALYEICARYVDSPGHKTARRHWRWWLPVLTGIAVKESKTEYRYFKRDVLQKAVVEINECTNLEIRGPIEFKGSDNKTIEDIQFEVYLRSRVPQREKPRPLANIVVDELPIIGRAINVGVKQGEAEALIEKHGAGVFSAAVAELEKRQKMPSEKVGAVLKPGAWLKAHLSRISFEAKEEGPDAASSRSKGLSAAEITKRQASWTEEWLRRRKTGLRRVFDDFDDEQQKECIEEFREHLKVTEQAQALRRLDLSGWEHRLVIEAFLKFFGVKTQGDGWDKPSSGDILAVAAELASVPLAN